MIPVAEPWITDNELELVVDAVERGWLSPNGDYIPEFEEAFAEFVDTEFAFATSTGTAALHLSLVAAGVGSGDEVVVPNLTWISCANVVRYVGATPVFAPVDTETLTLDVESARDLLTEDTVAIMPVHLYGQPCAMDEITALAVEHDLFVIEDAAEAHGATHRGRPVGGIGDVGCFSFYGNKILTTGQGGMVTTDDPDVAERIRLYRRDGMSHKRKYFHEVVGYNYRLTNLQAAVGVAQVQRAAEIIDAKRRVAGKYRELLADAALDFPVVPESTDPTYWMNVPVFDSMRACDRVQEALADTDIETRPLFYPLHDQPPYRASDSVRADSYATSMTLYERGLNLPSSPTLSEDDVQTVCTIVRDTLAAMDER